MGLFDKLFGKKRNTDGQEEYFKEDFPPVVNVPSTKKTAEPEQKEPVNKSSGPKSEAKGKSNVKKEEPKPTKKAPDKSNATKVTANSTKAVKNRQSEASKKLQSSSPALKGSVTVEESKINKNGKWDIQRAKDGRYFFTLYASNHTAIAYSQLYSSSSAAMNGIKSIIANAATTPIEDGTLKKTVSLNFPKWEIYTDKAGKYRFRLYASNGLCICHSSHGYSSKSGCKGGIDSIGRFASDATKIDKSYLK